MSVSGIRESDVEKAALDWFEELGYETLHGPDIAPDEPYAERTTYGDVALMTGCALRWRGSTLESLLGSSKKLCSRSAAPSLRVLSRATAVSTRC